MENDLLTVYQTAEYLKVSDKTVRRLIKSNQLAASKVGDRVWRVKESDIEKYLTANTNEKSDE